MTGLCALAAVSALSFVDPFIGTTAKCHCTPAAARPFGMVMPGPDTRINSWDATSGYDSADSTLLGFSQTHISGTGCPDLGDVLIHPVSGTLVDGDYRSAFRHADERAEPGYYAVDLPGFQVKGEMTCTERVSFYRFTYRSDDAHHLMVDTQHGIAFPGNLSKHVVSASADFPDAWTMTGSAHLRNWVERELHWVMRFDRPVVARKETPHPWGGVGKRYFLTFGIPAGEALQVKVALSMTGVDGAWRNLEAELPHWDFARVRDEARKSWNDLLGRIEIDGVDEKAKRIFYTAFYHALLHPDDIADVDGRYRGADGKVAVSPNGHYYSTLSLWDSFRAQQPLIAEFVPERVDGIVQTLLLHWKAAGFLPIWGLAGRDNQCMVGSHAVPVIVDAYLRGFRGFDVDLAYEAVRDTLRNAHPTRRKERWDLLDGYGYYPYDEIRGESVSRTLECAYDDACAARFAEALGKTEDAAFFRRRAANWTNVIDRTIGFARGKDKAGRWREPFDPLTCGQGAEHPNDFTEGNAWQYTWHVMHDPQGLVSWLGGKEAFERKLDRLFVEPPVMKGFGTMEYLENAIGQYAHGNEQVHHVPWLYACIGRRDKASACVRRICEACYSDTPAGYCGNEDCGQLGAWYVFAVLGRYPVDPCGGAYVESEPLAPVVRVKVGVMPETVLLDGKPGADAVTVEADGRVVLSGVESASTVVLKWTRNFPADAKFLGGMWERTYGDSGWRRRDEGFPRQGSMPWYFLVRHDGVTDGYGVKVQPNAFASWKVTPDGVELLLDVRAGSDPVRLNGRRLELCTLVFRKGVPGESAYSAGRAFCRLMCPQPRLPREQVYGYNDWYCAYGRNTATNFLSDAGFVVSLLDRGGKAANRPFVVVDDGWQLKEARGDAVPDEGQWVRSNDRWGMAMDEFCRRVKALDARPGLWYRPLMPWKGMPDALKTRGIATNIWNGGDFSVDPTSPELAERIRRDLRRFAGWGIELVKIDFITYDWNARWGFDLGERVIDHDGCHWRDRSRTTAEVVRGLYATLRDAAGDGMYIIGCNAIDHFAAGLFELQRTGDDTSGRDWERTCRMGPNTLGMRAMQNGTFYLGDGDCVGLVREGLVPWEKNRQWLDLVAKSGTSLFLSWKRSLAADPEVASALSKALKTASCRRRTGEPLDWMERERPRRWRFDGESDATYDAWD